MTVPELPSPLHSLPSSALHPIFVDKGETLFRQGDAVRGMFFLASGEIKLARHTENGETISIHRAMAGETFAEASLFSETYHCNAIARMPGRIIEIDRHILVDVFHRDAEFALAIAARFAGQVQTYRRRIELLAIRSAEDRVLDAVRDGLLVSDIKTFSTTIGLTHEATYRALAALVRKGHLVKPERGRYRLS